MCWLFLSRGVYLYLFGNVFATGFIIHCLLFFPQAYFLTFLDKMFMFSTKLWINQVSNRGSNQKYLPNLWHFLLHFAGFA